MGNAWDGLFTRAAAPLHEKFFVEDEPILRAPFGDWDRVESVTIYFWTEAQLAGSNQEDGEGEVLHNKSGKRILETARFDVLVAQEVDKRDFWRKDGVDWYTVRIDGKDDRWKTVLVKRVDGLKTKRSRVQ